MSQISLSLKFNPKNYMFDMFDTFDLSGEVL